MMRNNSFDLLVNPFIHLSFYTVNIYLVLSYLQKLRAKKGKQNNLQKSEINNMLLGSTVTVIILAIFIMFSWPMLSIFFLYTNAPIYFGIREINNPARQLVAVIVPYANSVGWKEIGSFNGNKAMNYGNSYEKTYQTTQPAAEVIDNLSVFLKQQSYFMQPTRYYSSEYISTHKNEKYFMHNVGDFRPYWKLEGRSSSGHSVKIKILDSETYNPPSTNVLGNGENQHLVTEIASQETTVIIIKFFF